MIYLFQASLLFLNLCIFTCGEVIQCNCVHHSTVRISAILFQLGKHDYIVFKIYIRCLKRLITVLNIIYGKIKVFI